MVKKGCFRRIISLALFAISVLSITVTAAYYNTYSTVATIPNGNGCNRAQGFAVGSSYVYTAKCNDDEEDFAYEIIEECYDLPEFAKTYFDYEKFARDLFMCDYWFDDGFVFRAA